MKNSGNTNENIIPIPTNAVIFNSDDGKKYAGIATTSYFASKAFIEGDRFFERILGQKFGWYCFSDNAGYCDSKYNFSRPSIKEWQTLFTEEQRKCCWKWM